MVMCATATVVTQKFPPISLTQRIHYLPLAPTNSKMLMLLKDPNSRQLLRLFLSEVGSVNKYPQIQQNPPQLKPKEKSNLSPTTKQAQRTIGLLSETSPRITWLY